MEGTRKTLIAQEAEEYANYAYYQELERAWRLSLAIPSDKKLLEVFPEAKMIIPSKIAEWQEKYDQLENEITRDLDEINWIKPKFLAEVFENLLETTKIPRLTEIEQHIFRLKRQLAISKNKKGKARSWVNRQEKKRLAKDYPIAQLARDKLDLRPAGQNFVALCPFHNEKTPSFYLYTASNTYHCFGCQAHGDTINLAMHLYGVGFNDAVEMLQI